MTRRTLHAGFDGVVADVHRCAEQHTESARVRCRFHRQHAYGLHNRVAAYSQGAMQRIYHLRAELLRFAAGLLGCVPRFGVELLRVAAILAADIRREELELIRSSSSPAHRNRLGKKLNDVPLDTSRTASQ